MALLHVQSIKNRDSLISSIAATFASATTTGNFIAVVVTCNSLTDITSVTDNKTNTYTLATRYEVDAATDFEVEIWYTQNITGGATHTVTASGPDYSQYFIGIYEFSGVATASSLDITKTNTGTATTWTTGASNTTTQADEVIIAGFASGGGTHDLSGDAGYSNYLEDETNTALISASETKIVSSTGAQTATVTSSQSIQYAAILATFKAVAAGPTGVKTINDLVTASVKTINDTVIASVKTING